MMQPGSIAIFLGQYDLQRPGSTARISPTIGQCASSQVLRNGSARLLTVGGPLPPLPNVRKGVGAGHSQQCRDPISQRLFGRIPFRTI